MYQALYRKWRPDTFSQVVGQEHITSTLQHQVADGKIGHAYLFTGSRGTGKTTVARILAKAINCESPIDGAPCCKCDACLGIANGTLMDVTELDAASNSGVDQVRALREEAIYTPSVLKKRVYIIDEVHMLSVAAFNALLKILEEPPEHLVFILATTELHKVLPTILSRCQRFSFKRILPRDIEKQLMYIAAEECIPLTTDGSEILSRLANGALRDALSLLDQCRSASGSIDAQAVMDVLGLTGSIQTIQMMRYILDKNTGDMLMLFDQLYRAGKDILSLLGELSDLARDLMIIKTAPDAGAALLTGLYDNKSLKELGDNQTSARFLYIANTLQECRASIGNSSRPRTDAELCLLRLCDESLSGDLTAINTRISKLENAIAKGIRISTIPAQNTQPPISETQAAVEQPAASYIPPVQTPPEPASTYAEKSHDVPSQPQTEPQKQFAASKTTSVAAVSQTHTNPASQGDPNIWAQLLPSYQASLPVNKRVMLGLARGYLYGDVMKIECNDFLKQQLDDPAIRDILINVTSQHLGYPITVQFEVDGKSTAAQRVNIPRPQPVRPKESSSPAVSTVQYNPHPTPVSASSVDAMNELIEKGKELKHFEIKKS